MSSDLLEQAMIDAAALKEAAMKNAENALIEKYSQEFNQTVQKLLEQEMPAPAAPADASAMPPPAGDPSAATPDAAAPDMSAAGADPMAGNLDMQAQNDKAFSKVPGSFSGDDEEMITINFDQIKATLNEMYDAKQQDPASDALAQGKANPDVVVKVKGSKNDVVETYTEPVSVGAGDAEAELEEWEQEEYELEEDGMGGSDDTNFSGQGVGGGMMELEEVELEETAATKQSLATKEKDLANAKAADAAADAEEAKQSEKQKSTMTPESSTSTLSEDIELTEEELQELAEELKVDLKVGNLSDGWLGSTETQKREQRNVELAAARDDKATEERAAEVEKMSDLMKENKKLKSVNGEALKAVSLLKEQVEKLNLLNAKLLYTNKALANISLNERQKSNIVESISRADSVLAAKTIYETVQNAVENITKEQEAPQSLRETLNRAASPFVAKKSANNSVNDLMAERMKALAGIKKLS
jgi:hypothetical protein